MKTVALFYFEYLRHPKKELALFLLSSQGTKRNPKELIEDNLWF